MSGPQSAMVRPFWGEDPPTPGWSATTMRTPNEAVRSSSGLRISRESENPWQNTTGVPSGSPTSS